MGELFRVSMPFVSTNDDISKNFLLSGGDKECGKAQMENENVIKKNETD